MFRGASNHTIDAKGRVIIPARFRKKIQESGSDGLMLSRLDRCLVGYTFDKWQEIETRILSMAQKSEAMRRFRRVFIGGAFDCELDRHERILVPPSLREYAKLERDIVLVGVLDHFEIWSLENWENENKVMEIDLQQEAVRNEISGLGL